jgi:hypothetical protein
MVHRNRNTVPSRRIMRLGRRAAEASNSTVWCDPIIDAEWQDVIACFFPEWRHVVGRRDVRVFIAEHAVDDEWGEVDGFAYSGQPLVVLDASVVNDGLAVCRATLVHEGVHIVCGYCAIRSRIDVSALEQMCSHGPVWGHRMALAARLAHHRGEHELTELLLEDAEDARRQWNDVGPEITEVLGGMPELRPWFS